MTNIVEINRLADLRPHAAAWAELLAQSPTATFFHTLDWLEVYWKHFGEGQKLRVLLLEREGRIAGILPLVVRDEPRKFGKVRVLTYPLDDWGSHYGPIGPEPQAILEAGLAHVQHTRRDWQLLDLRWVSGELEQATQQALENQGLRVYRTLREQTALVDLKTVSWDAYWASRGTKWRNNFRRWGKRLAERGSTDYLRYRPQGAAAGEGDPRWDLYDACLRIAEKSWQGASTTGTTLTHPPVAAFLRDVHAAAAAAGCLDLNLMTVGGVPAAFAYNYFYRGHVYGLRVGFDRELSSDGIGNLLYGKILEDSFARGDRLYDFGPGSLECKRSFLTRLEPLHQYTHFHPLAPRAQMLRLKHVLPAWLVSPKPGDAPQVSL